MKERQQELSEMKLKLMKFNLVILMLFGMGCASDGPMEPCWKWDWAQKQIGPIEEPEPEGLPEDHQTVYIPDNTL